MVDYLLAELGGMMGRQQPPAVQAYIDAKFSGTPAEIAAIRQIMGTYCRHCIRNSTAVVKHSQATCKAMGNLPNMPCLKCARLGRT
eukprot:6432277-Pyramimonas_sp.AAC.1